MTTGSQGEKMGKIGADEFLIINYFPYKGFSEEIFKRDHSKTFVRGHYYVKKVTSGNFLLCG